MEANSVKLQRVGVYNYNKYGMLQLKLQTRLDQPRININIVTKELYWIPVYGVLERYPLTVIGEDVYQWSRVLTKTKKNRTKEQTYTYILSTNEIPYKVEKFIGYPDKKMYGQEHYQQYIWKLK